jgi:hypothetical protein
VKYMIMMFGCVGEALETKSSEWLENMHSFVQKLDQELKENGEVVGGGRLVDPAQATTVRFAGGIAVPTDGPFAEIKESVVGYWLIEADERRAIDIAAQMAVAVENPIEVRRVMDEAPEM